LHLVDTGVLQFRLAEAEAIELPSLDHSIVVEPNTTLVTKIGERQIVMTMLPLVECLRLPGITDGKLFRKNVRQSLGSTNKVNRAMRSTLHSKRVKDFFYFHNGVTALCDSMEVSNDKKMLSVRGLSVVNGCQSISTIFNSSERVRSDEAKDAHILFRLYEIPDRAFGDSISINTNSQSAVKPRDLRSNDKQMVGLKRAYEVRFPDGCLLTKRGEARPADRDAHKTVDIAILAKMIMAWHCQRPNISANEKKLFDEYYKSIFRPGYEPGSVLALQVWLNAIEDAFPNLALNDVLKAGKSHVKYHLLFSVSAIIAGVNRQTQSVIEPHFTMDAAKRAGEILPLAANCLENALQSAVNTAQMNNRVFSPQNWLKSIQSVQGQMLVAGTVAGMLPQMPNSSSLIEVMTAPLDGFHPRWSAD
jgi:AIPR protein